jgi:hypothetical protein
VGKAVANNANLKPWRPGQSGNPAGHSKARRASKALAARLDAGRAADQLAAAWLALALAGDPVFFAMLLNRIEGRVGRRKDEPAGLADVHARMTAYSDPDATGDPSVAGDR